MSVKVSTIGTKYGSWDGGPAYLGVTALVAEYNRLHKRGRMLDFQVPVLVFDSGSRRILSVNEAAASLFKFPAKDMEGRPLDGCVVAEERARLEAILGTTEPRWGDVGSWKCVARDGSRFVAQIRFHQTMQEGRLVHVVLATEVVHLEADGSAAAG